MALNVSIQVTGDCQNTSSGVLFLQPLNGNPPYIFDWQSPNLGIDTLVNTSSKSGLSAGTYLVLIQDSTTPSPNQQFLSLSISSGVCVSNQSFDTTCGNSNGQLVVSAVTKSNSANYLLYDINNNFISSATSASGFYSFTNLSANTYYAKVIDQGGCSGSTASCIIKNSNSLDFGFFIVNNSSCNPNPTGKIFITGLTGQPPYTYSWLPSGQITSSISGLTSAIYGVQVTDANGCTTQKSATVGDVPVLSINSFIAVPPTCFQSDGTLIVNITGGTGPYYYLLTNQQPKITYDQSPMFTGLSVGSYTLTVIDAALCTASQSFGLSIPNAFTDVTVVPVGSTCNRSDGSISIFVQGGSIPYTYILTDSLGGITSSTLNITSKVFNNLPSGNYNVKVSGSCSYEENVTITNSDKFNIFVETINTSCGNNNGQIKITADTFGSYSYFINGQLILSQPITAVTFSGLVSGVYDVKVVDSTQCEKNTQVVVNNSEIVDFTLVPTSCGSGSDGTITVYITAGVAPFILNWSPNVGGQSGIYVTNLEAGTYELEITDALGCKKKKSVVITCPTRFKSSQTFNVCDGNFVQTVGTKTGIKELYNQGYLDITGGDINCKLNDAEFLIRVTIGGSAYTTNFFSSNSLINFPTDQQYATALENLIESVPGVGALIVDIIGNTIKINTDCEKTISGEDIQIDILIEYDVCCEQPESCVDVFFSSTSFSSLTRFNSGGTRNNSTFWVGKIDNCILEIYYNNVTNRWETNGFKPLCGSLVTESYSYIGPYGFYGNLENYIFFVNKVEKCCNTPILPNIFNNFISANLTPTPTPSFTPTPTTTQPPTPTPTNSETPTNTPTNTETPTNTPTNSETPTNTPTNSETPTNTPTNTETPTNTPTNTETPTNTPTNSETPTPTPTNSETPTPTPTNSETPTPTPTNTETPTNTPTQSITPTNTITNTPSPTPTNTLTHTPTNTLTPTPSTSKPNNCCAPTITSVTQDPVTCSVTLDFSYGSIPCLSCSGLIIEYSTDNGLSWNSTGGACSSSRTLNANTIVNVTHFRAYINCSDGSQSPRSAEVPFTPTSFCNSLKNVSATTWTVLNDLVNNCSSIAPITQIGNVTVNGNGIGPLPETLTGCGPLGNQPCNNFPILPDEYGRRSNIGFTSKGNGKFDILVNISRSGGICVYGRILVSDTLDGPSIDQFDSCLSASNPTPVLTFSDIDLLSDKFYTVYVTGVSIGDCDCATLTC